MRIREHIKLGKEDRVAVIDFDSSATILCSLKSDKENAKKAIKAIDSSGNTDIVDALKKSLKVINDNYEDKNKKMVILLTDGKSNTAGYKSICNSLKEKNASVYTIGLGNNVNTSFLKSIASITDGKYYHANEADELNKYFNKIRKEYEGAKDSDGDGICDYYEDNFIIGSGATMKLNKNDPDSDGDGITDGKETKFIRKKKDGSFHSFVVYSLPSEKDSDGDELWDNEDDTKLHAWKAKTGI